MKTFTPKKLQNSEHFAFFTDVLKLLNEANLAPLKNLKDKIAVDLQKEDDAQKQIRKSGHTVQIDELDTHRDEIFRGLVLRLQSEQLSEIASRREAANRLMIVVDTYGNLTKFNLQKETAEIGNLVQDLRSANYQPSMAEISVEDWTDWLDDANNAFDSLYTSRRDDLAAMPDFDMKNIRKTLDDDFAELQKMLSALETLSPTPALAALIAKLDTSTERWKETLAQRRGNAAAKKDTPK